MHANQLPVTSPCQVSPFSWCHNRLYRAALLLRTPNSRPGTEAMPRFLPFFLSLIVAVLLIGGPIGYAYNRPLHMRNFPVVPDGVLYLSGHMSLFVLKC